VAGDWCFFSPITNHQSPITNLMSETFLTSISHSHFTQTPDLTPMQAQIDGLVSTFVERTADGYALAGVVFGSAANRGIRSGILNLGRSVSHLVPGIFSPLTRFTALAGGFAAESTLFEVAPKGIKAALKTGDISLLNLFGVTGFGYGTLHSAVSLFSLKLAGIACASLNPVAQYLFQSSAMVSAHHLSSRWGITDNPTENLMARWIDAQSMVLTLWAGMNLLHGLAPDLAQREQTRDLLIQSNNVGAGFPRPTVVQASSRPRLGTDLVGIAIVDGGTIVDGETPPLHVRPNNPRGRPSDFFAMTMERPISVSALGKKANIPIPLAKLLVRTEKFEPRIEAPDLLEKIPEKLKTEILESLRYPLSQLKQLNEKDMGRGLGMLFDNYFDKMVELASPQFEGKRFSELPPEYQHAVRMVDHGVDILEYAKRSNQRELIDAVWHAANPIIRTVYSQWKETLRSVLGPHFDLPEGPYAKGEEVLEPHQAVLSIGAGGASSLLALMRHRVRPGEFSWRWRSFAMHRNEEVTQKRNNTGIFKIGEVQRQVNFDGDPLIQIVTDGSKDYDRLRKLVRVQFINVPSKELLNRMTKEYITHLPENAILVQVIGGFIEGGRLPHEVIRERLDFYGRTDVEVVTGSGFIPDWMLWDGVHVNMSFSSREKVAGKGPNPAAGIVAKAFAGETEEGEILGNDYVTAKTSHWDLSNNLGKTTKNVFAVSRGRKTTHLAIQVVRKEETDPENAVLHASVAELEYEKSGKEILRVMADLLRYNEKGINKHWYQQEVENDILGSSEINFSELLKVTRLACAISLPERTPERLSRFLVDHVMNNAPLAKARNVRGGIALAFYEMWKEEGFPYSYEEIKPKVTLQGVDGLIPFIDRYHPQNDIERRRLPQMVYDLYRALYPNRPLEIPPQIPTHLRETALQGKISQINVEELRQALEGVPQETITRLNKEIEKMQNLRTKVLDPSDRSLSRQEQLVSRMITVMKDGHDVVRIHESPYTQPPYENVFWFQLRPKRGTPVESQYVYVRAQGTKMMERLTHLGMLFRSLDEKTPITLELDVAGKIASSQLWELSNTVTQMIGTFVQYRQKPDRPMPIRVDLNYESEHGVQKTTLKSNPPPREELSQGYFNALRSLVRLLNRSFRKSSQRKEITAQDIRNEAGNTSRLIDQYLLKAPGWPMLLDYYGGPINEAIKAALTRPERATLIGAYSKGKLVDVFNVYRNVKNEPRVLSHSILLRIARKKKQSLSSIDLFEGKPLEDFLKTYEKDVKKGKEPLSYRILQLKSVPIEDALVGQIEGVDPSILRVFLKSKYPERNQMLFEIAPYYERPMEEVKDEVRAILQKYLTAFVRDHQIELQEDPLYQFFQKNGLGALFGGSPAEVIK
jgi:hypothetical protein